MPESTQLLFIGNRTPFVYSKSLRVSAVIKPSSRSTTVACSTEQDKQLRRVSVAAVAGGKSVIITYCECVCVPALKVNSICEGNYRGLSMWLSTQQVDY